MIRDGLIVVFMMIGVMIGLGIMLQEKIFGKGKSNVN